MKFWEEEENTCSHTCTHAPKPKRKVKADLPLLGKTSPAQIRRRRGLICGLIGSSPILPRFIQVRGLFGCPPAPAPVPAPLNARKKGYACMQLQPPRLERVQSALCWPNLPPRITLSVLSVSFCFFFCF